MTTGLGRVQRSSVLDESCGPPGDRRRSLQGFYNRTALAFASTPRRADPGSQPGTDARDALRRPRSRVSSRLLRSRRHHPRRRPRRRRCRHAALDQLGDRPTDLPPQPRRHGRRRLAAPVNRVYNSPNYPPTSRTPSSMVATARSLRLLGRRLGLPVTSYRDLDRVGFDHMRSASSLSTRSAPPPRRLRAVRRPHGASAAARSSPPDREPDRTARQRYRRQRPSLAPTTVLPSPLPSISCPTARPIYRLNLADAGGDGWQGAPSYRVYNASDYPNIAMTPSMVANGTLASGFSGVDWVCLADGCYEIVVDGGAADSEIGFEFVGEVGGHFQDFSAPYADHMGQSAARSSTTPTASPTTPVRLKFRPGVPTPAPSVGPAPAPTPPIPAPSAAADADADDAGRAQGRRLRRRRMCRACTRRLSQRLPGPMSGPTSSLTLAPTPAASVRDGLLWTAIRVVGVALFCFCFGFSAACVARKLRRKACSSDARVVPDDSNEATDALPGLGCRNRAEARASRKEDD